MHENTSFHVCNVNHQATHVLIVISGEFSIFINGRGVLAVIIQIKKKNRIYCLDTDLTLFYTIQK